MVTAKVTCITAMVFLTFEFILQLRDIIDKLHKANIDNLVMS